MAEFYVHCGGVDLYAAADCEIRIVDPAELLPSNIVILGEQFDDDPSSSWYVIAESPNREYLSIDLAVDRNGRCYDSFHEVHGIVGSCPVIALTFTELLARLLAAQGDHWYWLEPDFVGLGDAYG
ncbi:MAG: hypothetical protein ACJ73S_11320 [Mycobacteriales bacterium]